MMKWYWQTDGVGHIHVRVFVNGANCGNLCFSFMEFNDVSVRLKGAVHFSEVRPCREPVLQAIEEAQP